MPERINENGELTDGIFDDINMEIRQKYVRGKVTHTISKMWIESKNPEHLSRLDDWMKLPWTSYPDLPPKQKRK